MQKYLAKLEILHKVKSKRNNNDCNPRVWPLNIGQDPNQSQRQCNSAHNPYKAEVSITLKKY